jgi:hypothetical protein
MLGARGPAPTLPADPRLPPPPALHHSPVTTHQLRISNRWYLPHFFFARVTTSTSNRYTYPIKNRPNSLSANTKCISNRYDSSNSHLRAALQSSLVANACHRLTPFLFATNKPRKIIILLSSPMKTKEKQLSIRYKWSLRGTGLPAAEGHLACALWCWVAPLPSAPRITQHQSPLTNTTSALDSIHRALLIVGRTAIQERP